MRTYEHRSTATGYNVWYVDEGCTKQVAKDKPDYIEWLKNNTPAVIPYVAPVLPTQAEIDAEICKQTVFKKLDIRRAMRELNLEAILDTLLQDTTFKADWNDATEIDLSDPYVVQALASVELDVDVIKLQIVAG